MSIAAAKPRPMRMNQRAVLVPVERFAEWRQIASATLGLTELDRKVLAAIAGGHEQRAKGHAPSLTFESLSVSTDARAVDISIAIKRLIGFGLIAVKPGSGRHPNVYLLALPKRIVATLSSAAAVDDAPPF